eukprot:TRINITY_DN51620_c0_g1_i1.p1 TRINITY_DN51620_c0_g1~~TRINITY_DN51620_c0_g1_i1.p1  ORF type:complete len:790 (+),score=272.27 TRINITY_DN51620_c0_g1_i1:123-2492(+)
MSAASDMDVDDRPAAAGPAGGLRRNSSGSVSSGSRPFVLGPRTADTAPAQGLSRQASGLSRRGSSGRLKLNIRPLAAPQLPEGFKEDAWAKLEEAVLAVYRTEEVRHSKESLYAAVESLCMHGGAAACAEKLRVLCDTHTAEELETTQDQVSKGAETFLRALGRVWDSRCSKINITAQIFACLDRDYLLKHGRKPLWDQGLELFATHLRRRDAVLNALLSSLLDTIRLERTGNAIDRALLAKLVRMLCDLGMYKQCFEEKFIAATRSFYDEEGRSVVQGAEGFDISRYLHLVEQRLSEEEDRVQTYLDYSTRRPLRQVVEVHLIQHHAREVIDKGLGELIDANKIPELSLLFGQTGLPSVNCRMLLRDAFKAYIKQNGMRRVSDEDSDATLVVDLLGFKKKLDLVLNDAFGRLQEFRYALRDSFESFINSRANRASELLAKFLDQKQKASAKETDDEIEPVMDACLDLFRMLQSKDVFLAFYHKDFAKRLLLNRSASQENEKLFISKLKQEGGPGYTSKLESMLHDMDSSRDLAAQFRQSANGAEVIGDIDFSVQVLTLSHWPTTPPIEVHVPPQLEAVLESFKEFYLKRHQGRRLVWPMNLAMCTLKALCFKSRKELIVSMLQALVLLLFNDATKLTFGDIRSRTAIEVEELRRIVQSLALSQHKVLRRAGKGGREVQDSDVFSVNEEFTHKQYKIKINQIQSRETQEEVKRTNEQVFRDRVHAVDACIVRTMKSRRAMLHTELIAAVFSALKFPVQGSDIKKRIESLIERDYLKRDETQTNRYHYCA